MLRKAAYRAEDLPLWFYASTRLFTSQRAARVHRADEGALSKSRDTRAMRVSEYITGTVYLPYPVHKLELEGFSTQCNAGFVYAYSYYMYPYCTTHTCTVPVHVPYYYMYPYCTTCPVLYYSYMCWSQNRGPCKIAVRSYNIM